MAEPKVVTVIITVNLECRHDAAKIKSTLCKLERCFKINSIIFDIKKNTVTVSGPFDPHRFICKLRCMAGMVIKDVVIKPDPPPPPPPPPPPVPPPPPPPCLPCPSPMWCCCYQPCYQPPHGGCSSCGYFPCPPWPPAPQHPCGSQPCYKIVCEYGPFCGCSHK